MKNFIIRIKNEVLIIIIFTISSLCLGLIYNQYKTNDYLATILVKSYNNDLISLHKQASIINNKRLIDFYYENNAKKIEIGGKLNIIINNVEENKLDFLEKFYFKIKEDLKLNDTANDSIFIKVKEELIKDKKIDPRFLQISINDFNKKSGIFAWGSGGG